MKGQKTAAMLLAGCLCAAGLTACGHSHGWGEWQTKTPASCTEAGREQRTCSGCGEAEYNVLPATGHAWGEWMISETAHHRECANGCGARKDEAAHAYGGGTVCTVCGYETYTKGLTFAEVFAADGETAIGYEVTGCAEALGEIVVPACHEGLPVTAIASRAFYGESGITALRLPNTVSEIGANAFNKCTELEEVVFSEGLKTIDASAFAKCGFKRIELPSGLQTVGAKAFSNCAALESVSVGRGIETFEAGAFYLSRNVKRVDFHGTADAWSQIAFGNALANPLNQGATFSVNGEVVSHLVLEDAEAVNEYAFTGAKLTSVTLGKNVTTVGQDAFSMWETEFQHRIARVVILNRRLTVRMNAFNYALAEKAEIFYCGTAKEMADSVTYEAENRHYFTNCRHYFYSDNPDAEAEVTEGADWNFGGFWHLVNGTVEKYA